MENEFILGSIPRDYRFDDLTCSIDEIEIPNSFKLVKFTNKKTFIIKYRFFSILNFSYPKHSYNSIN